MKFGAGKIGGAGKGVMKLVWKLLFFNSPSITHPFKIGELFRRRAGKLLTENSGRDFGHTYRCDDAPSKCY